MFGRKSVLKIPDPAEEALQEIVNSNVLMEKENILCDAKVSVPWEVIEKYMAQVKADSCRQTMKEHNESVINRATKIQACIDDHLQSGIE